MDMKKSHLINAQNFTRLIELFDVSSTGLWEMDANEDVIFYNAHFYKSFDIPLTNSKLKDWTNIIHPEDQAIFSKRLTHHYESKVESYKSEYRVFNNSGEIVWIKALGVAHYDSDGHLLYMVGYHTDITLERTYKDQLYRTAYVDEETGFFNRKKLLEDIEKDLHSNQPATLIIMELFKYHHILPIHGHQFLDKMMTEGKKATQEMIGNHWIPYRLAPNEIGLLSHKLHSQEDVSKLLSQINLILNQLSESENLSGNLKITAGVITYPINNITLTAEDIVKRTYLTLSESKRMGNGTILMYREDEQSNMLRTLYIENTILKALKNNEFFVVYHPIVNVNTNELVSFEALIRWQSKEWGPIPPIDFIPVAEKNHDIIAIGDFVFHEALTFISKYNTYHDSNIQITLNISIIQLLQKDFASKVIGALEKYQLSYDTLILEVTESIMIDDPTLIVEQLKHLKSLGVGIALDDFGSGYASLNTCILLPLTEVKIDRQIMKQALNAPLISDFLKNVINLFHDYHAKVVGEGIETSDMIDISKQLGIDQLQGFYFTKPLKSDEAMDYT